MQSLTGTPLAFLGIGFLTTMAVLAVWRHRSAPAGTRNPLARELLRAPGESLRGHMSVAMLDAAEYAALGLFLLPLMFIALAQWWTSGGPQPGRDEALILLAAGAAVQAWILARLWRVLGRHREFAIRYEAEVAAGQALDELRHLGYRVYHDVPARELRSNVDHVVVGPPGVFVVGTEGRARPPAGNGDEEPWEVAYDGETLKFPGWKERMPLVHAIEQANEVAAWLSKAVGEPVPVHAVLVLPGWSVKRTSIEGIPVLGARRIPYFFSRRNESLLGEEMIERLACELDRRCREMTPSGAGTPGKGAS